jgi:hypothetical protein
MASDISKRLLALANMLLEICEDSVEAEIDELEIIDLEEIADSLKEISKRLR